MRKKNYIINRKNEQLCLCVGGPFNDKKISLNPSATGTIIFIVKGLKGCYDKRPFDLSCTWRLVA